MTAYTGKAELGQGIGTAQTQLVAEELCVPLRSREADCLRHGVSLPIRATRPEASRIPANFNHSNLAQAAATAREALLRLASDRLGVPADQLAAADGVIALKTDSSRKVSYQESARRAEIQSRPR